LLLSVEANNTLSPLPDEEHKSEKENDNVLQLARHGVTRKTCSEQMLFLTLRLFNELARRPGRVLIVCCLLCELRATEEQLAARVTDGTISVMKLTVAFVFDGTKQHS